MSRSWEGFGRRAGPTGTLNVAPMGGGGKPNLVIRCWGAGVVGRAWATERDLRMRLQRMLERGPEGRMEKAENRALGYTQFARPEETRAGKGGEAQGRATISVICY